MAMTADRGGAAVARGDVGLGGRGGRRRRRPGWPAPPSRTRHAGRRCPRRWAPTPRCAARRGWSRRPRSAVRRRRRSGPAWRRPRRRRGGGPRPRRGRSPSAWRGHRPWPGPRAAGWPSWAPAAPTDLARRPSCARAPLESTIRRPLLRSRALGHRGAAVHHPRRAVRRYRRTATGPRSGKARRAVYPADHGPKPKPSVRQGERSCAVAGVGRWYWLTGDERQPRQCATPFRSRRGRGCRSPLVAAMEDRRRRRSICLTAADAEPVWANARARALGADRATTPRPSTGAPSPTSSTTCSAPGGRRPSAARWGPTAATATVDRPAAAGGRRARAPCWSSSPTSPTDTSVWPAASRRRRAGAALAAPAVPADAARPPAVRQLPPGVVVARRRRRLVRRRAAGRRAGRPGGRRRRRATACRPPGR